MRLDEILHLNQCNATFLCLTQARIWISNIICHALFCVQWFEMRGGCSFRWYLWNCWSSQFKFSFHNEVCHLLKSEISFFVNAKRGGCSFRWYLWNCWSSQFKFSFHNEVCHLLKSEISFFVNAKRGGCSFRWYLWNCWSSQFKFSFHNEVCHLLKSEISFFVNTKKHYYTDIFHELQNSECFVICLQRLMVKNTVDQRHRDMYIKYDIK